MTVQPVSENRFHPCVMSHRFEKCLVRSLPFCCAVRKQPRYQPVQWSCVVCVQHQHLPILGRPVPEHADLCHAAVGRGHQPHPLLPQAAADLPRLDVRDARETLPAH